MLFSQQFSILSSRPEGLPKSPKPRLSKAKSASNIWPHVEQLFHISEKKHFTEGCAGLIVHALLTVYVVSYGICKMICKGKEKYLFAMSGRAGSAPRPLPLHRHTEPVGGGGVAGRVLPGDSERGRGVLWQVNTASCNGAYFWRVNSAG
jgi:hypothetical protein